MNRPPSFNPQGTGRGLQAVTRLDTNTGPRADGNDFGAGGYYAIGQGLGQLGEGLMRAGSYMREKKEERDRIEEEIWSTRTDIETRKHWAQKLHEAELKGTILDPATLEQEFQNDMLARLDSAPSERARMAAEKRLLNLGLSIYEQGLQQQAKFNYSRRLQDLEKTFEDFSSMGATAEEAHQSMTAFAEQFRGTAYEPQVQKLFQQHQEKLAERQLVEIMDNMGAATAAEQVRSGTLMSHLDPLRRLSMADSLAEKARAEQAAAAQQAAQAGLQDLRELFTADHELTPQTIFEREQKAAEMLASIRPGLSEAEYKKQADEITRRTAIDLINNASVNDLRGLQRMYERRYTYNSDDPTFKFINSQIEEKLSRLDPLSKDYDPAAIANHNPYLAQELQQTRAALLQNPGDAQAIAAATNSIEQSLTLQRARGVPQGAERLMTQEEVRTAVAALTKANNKPDQWRSIIAAYPEQYHGRIAAEIASHPDLPSATRLAMRAPENELLWKAASINMQKADKDAVKTISERLRNNDQFQQLLELTGDDSMRDAVLQASYYLTLPESGMNLREGDAVKYVLKHVLTEKVSIAETGGRKIAIPKTIARDNATADQIIKGLNLQLTQQLTDNSAGIALPETQFREGDNKEAIFRRYFHHVIKNGEWEPVPDGSGFRRIVRDENGQYAYVMGQDGKPLIWQKPTPSKLKFDVQVLNASANTSSSSGLLGQSAAEFAQKLNTLQQPEQKTFQVLTYTPEDLRAERFAKQAANPPEQPPQNSPEQNDMKTPQPPANNKTLPAPTQPQGTRIGSTEKLKSAHSIGDPVLDAIMDFEGRYTNGNLKITQLPSNDGGGAWEVAGINVRFHEKMANKLKTLIEQGKHKEAYAAAANYIKDYTDNSAAVRNATNPGVQAYLRDAAFNRGPTGATKILQMALGVKADGKMGKDTREALAAAERNPRQLLLNLRRAREEYELKIAGKRQNLWRGLVNRWDKALEMAMALT